VQDVIHVFHKVRQQIPCKLLLVGDGPERINMEHLCRELNTCNDVRFLGKLEAVEEVLSVADLFLMPSDKESFGLAALEAMACEVPLISTNAGGLPELNIQGKTGFLSTVGDIDDMVKNALFILQADQLPTFKKNALAQAKQFDIKQILPKYELFYEKIIREARQ
jgi:N-acetyl-alpha-D-glucosaminyl L-malate synthase BshA